MSCAGEAGWIRYESQRKDHRGSAGSFRARYRAIGNIFHAQLGSIEHFLAERYCLYAADAKGRTVRCEIHHPPWPLQLAEAGLQENSMVSAAGIRIAELKPELLHFSRRQEVVVWAPQVRK
jgi:uncharacterized protein YqjF (DUF2071 family)